MYAIKRYRIVNPYPTKVQEYRTPAQARTALSAIREYLIQTTKETFITPIANDEFECQYTDSNLDVRIWIEEVK